MARAFAERLLAGPVISADVRESMAAGLFDVAATIGGPPTIEPAPPGWGFVPWEPQDFAFLDKAPRPDERPGPATLPRESALESAAVGIHRVRHGYAATYHDRHAVADDLERAFRSLAEVPPVPEAVAPPAAIAELKKMLRTLELAHFYVGDTLARARDILAEVGHPAPPQPKVKEDPGC